MAGDPGPDGGAGRPSPVQEAASAADTLRDLRAIGHRSRQAATRELIAIPLVCWGVAWAAGYALLDLAPWRVAAPAGAGLAVAALAATWVTRRQRNVLSGWERRVQLGWVALMACSPFLVASVSPVPAQVMAVFLGALWGTGLLLFAVATGDRPLGALGAITVLAAAFCRPALSHHALLGFGLLAGLAMIALGGWRVAAAAGRDRLPSGLWPLPTLAPSRPPPKRPRSRSRTRWPRCCARHSTPCWSTRSGCGCRLPCTGCRRRAR